MQNICQENNKISYSLFCELLPFWTINLREKDRQACMCEIHHVQYCTEVENNTFLACQTGLSTVYTGVRQYACFK
jgi:hypothetical protein